MNAVIIQTTCSTSEEAKKIAKILIEEQLVACVQLSKIESLYIWNKEFCCDNETLLSIKTIKEKIILFVRVTLTSTSKFNIQPNKLYINKS